MFPARLGAMWLILQSLVAFVMQGPSVLEGLTIAPPVKPGRSAIQAQRFVRVAVLASTAGMLQSHALIALLVHTVVWLRLPVKLVQLVGEVLLVWRSARNVMLEDLWCSPTSPVVQYAQQELRVLEVHRSVLHVRVDLSAQRVQENVFNVTLASLQQTLFTVRIALQEPGVASHLPGARLVSMVPEAIPLLEHARFAQQALSWCNQIRPVKSVLLADMPTQVLLCVKSVKLAPTATNHLIAVLTALQASLVVSPHRCVWIVQVGDTACKDQSGVHHVQPAQSAASAQVFAPLAPLAPSVA